MKKLIIIPILFLSTLALGAFRSEKVTVGDTSDNHIIIQPDASSPKGITLQTFVENYLDTTAGNLRISVTTQTAIPAQNASGQTEFRLKAPIEGDLGSVIIYIDGTFIVDIDESTTSIKNHLIGATGEFSDTLTLDGGLVMGNVGDTTWGGFRLYMATMTSVDLPDSTTINSYPVVATHTTVLTISSDSYQGFSNLNVEAIATPPDHAITINRVRAYTVGTSTVQFSFAEYTFAGASGTDILSVSVATACNSGNTYTSFSNASIAAGSVAKITTGASSDTGSPTWVKFLIDWVYE